MSLRALLFRKAPEPQTIEVTFDGASYPVHVRRNNRARRYTAHSAGDARGCVDDAAAWLVARATAFAQRNGEWIAARLNRLPQDTPFAGRSRSSRARRAACDRTSSGRPRHGVDRSRRAAAALRRRPARASGAPLARFPQARSQERPRSGKPPLRRDAWRKRSSASWCATRRPAGLLQPPTAYCHIRGG